MAADHAFKRGPPGTGDCHQGVLSAAIAGKQRHTVLQRGEEDGSGLAVEGVAQFALTDGPLESFISWLIFSARRCL